MEYESKIIVEGLFERRKTIETRVISINGM